MTSLPDPRRDALTTRAPYLAHANPASGDDDGHLLADHLREVARLSADRAAPFNAHGWGWLAGLWHDLGKYRDGFQHYIRQSRDPDAHIEGRVVSADKTHSTAGALHAMQRLGPNIGRVLAFLIAGHHAGLPDGDPADGARASLSARLAAENADSQREYRESLAQAVPPDIVDASASLAIMPNAQSNFSLWLRMLFSCLVDADFLDTERYFDSAKFALRGQHPSLAALKSALDGHLATLSAQALRSSAGLINTQRAKVLASCREKATLSPGFFTLTVPTGGGKTLSSLAFALDHAITHGKRRIVYAIPYTSIIEQTSEVFRGVFSALGSEVIVEHHSNLDVDDKAETHATRLAAENWDAPLIVTTNVQLFESLHATRTSRCRKLHNLVDSVIVLDEAQMVPRDFLTPILNVLKALVAHYGVTVVLCTATQPMLASRYEPVSGRKLLDGIDDAREIADDVDGLFAALRRVDVHLPSSMDERSDWQTLATRLREQECVLAIVSTRADARDLYLALNDPDAIHLSASMCAEHRSRTLAEVRARLLARRDGSDLRPLRVVSTQLVEAGVDVDFPVVFRAMAGMDSIAQAAGRCNREGRLNGPGQVHVFNPPHEAPPGLLKQGEQTTRSMLAAGQVADPLAPATFRRYFDGLYAKDAVDFDRHAIGELLRPDRAAFRTAAARFRLIDDDAEAVVVPYKGPDGAIAASPVDAWLGVLAGDGNARWARRKLQRYTVNVHRREFDAMLRQGDVVVSAGLWLALDCRYDPRFGLLPAADHGQPTDYMA